MQNVNKAQIKVKTKNDNVAGVNLPVFESFQVCYNSVLFCQPWTYFKLLFRMVEILTSWPGLRKVDSNSRD